MTVWLERIFSVKLSTHTMMCRLAFPFSTRNTPPSATGFSPYRACKAFLRHDIKFSSPIRQLAFTSKTWNSILLFVSVHFNQSISITVLKNWATMTKSHSSVYFFKICRNIDNFFFKIIVTFPGCPSEHRKFPIKENSGLSMVSRIHPPSYKTFQMFFLC